MDDMFTPLTIAISGAHMSSIYFIWYVIFFLHLFEVACHLSAIPEHIIRHRHPPEAEVAHSGRWSLEPVLASGHELLAPPSLAHWRSAIFAEPV